jgi:hypothetical protein
MSYIWSIYLPQRQLREDEYMGFIEECACIKGEPEIIENRQFSYNSNGIVHECALIKLYSQHSKQQEHLRVRVFIDLYANHFFKKFCSSRQEFYWKILIETKMGRSIVSLAVQLIIPLKAFEIFSNIVVVEDGGKIFCDAKTYASYIKKDLLNKDHDVLTYAGLLDSEGNLLI